MILTHSTSWHFFPKTHRIRVFTTWYYCWSHLSLIVINISKGKQFLCKPLPDAISCSME